MNRSLMGGVMTPSEAIHIGSRVGSVRQQAKDCDHKNRGD